MMNNEYPGYKMVQCGNHNKCYCIKSRALFCLFRIYVVTNELLYVNIEYRIIVYLTKPDKNLDLVGKCLNAYCRISCSLDSVSNHDRSYVGEMKNK